MRIRSLHPSYLDAKGLVALWRETLLAKHVLKGKTKGYTMHPQLERFKSCSDPLSAINSYLTIVAHEASQRAYQFDTTKIGPIRQPVQIAVTHGQLSYEWDRLCEKLLTRDRTRYEEMKTLTSILPHPLFSVIDGDIASREKV